MITIYIDDDDNKLYILNSDSKLYLPDKLQNSSFAIILKENNDTFDIPENKCFIKSIIYNDEECIHMINTYHYFGLDFPYNEVLIYFKDGKNIQIYTIISRGFCGTKRLYSYYSECYFEVSIIDINIKILNQLLDKLNIVLYPINILLLAKSCPQMLNFVLQNSKNSDNFENLKIIYQHAIEYSNIELVKFLLNGQLNSPIYIITFKIKIHTLEMLEFLDKYFNITFNCLSWQLVSPFFDQMIIYLINSGKKLNKQQEDIISERYHIQYDHVKNIAQLI